LYIDDPIAAKKSKMLQRPAQCNGEKTGVKCKHYFSFAARTDAQNPEFLNLGEKFRNCTVCPGWLIEWDGWESLPHNCDRYVPDYRGFAWLVWRIKQILSFGRKIDKSFEDYTPMSQEEVTQLTKEAHDEERERIRLLHDAPPSTNLFDAVAQQINGGGIPGQTTMATPEMLKEQVQHIATVKEGKVTAEQVLAEMNFSNENSPLVTITKKKPTKPPTKKNPKAQKIVEADKEKSSDDGIFGVSNE
jgi:hypothetical protein